MSDMGKVPRVMLITDSAARSCNSRLRQDQEIEMNTTTEVEIGAVSDELDDKALELASGGGLVDTVNRAVFAIGCVLSGGTLSAKGSQLQCKT